MIFMEKLGIKSGKYITRNTKETQKLGVDLAKSILKLDKKPQKAIIITLSGELGGGKTTFLQGFAKGLKINEKILSPTFVIQKRFKVKNKNLKNFYHIDCYRLNNQKDILELGFADMTNDSENIIALEWPEKIKGFLRGKEVIKIRFKYLDQDTREIIFK